MWCTPKEEHDTFPTHSRHGVQLLVEKLALLREHALVFLSPPCCSWVWLSRSKSRRCKDSPLGDVATRFVDEGNRVAEVVSSVMLLAAKKKIHFLIEQPQSSLFFDHPLVKDAIEQITGIARINFKMGAFGA
eukprot:6492598-Amphidinium_carterae.2